MSNNSEFFQSVGTNVRAPEHAPYPSEAFERQKIVAGSKRWASSQSTYWGAEQTHDQIPSGMYKCSSSQDYGPVLIRVPQETDAIMPLPGSEGSNIVSEFKDFWSLEEQFRSRGFLHKRGFMLWGPPGSGKTSQIQLLIKEIIEMNGLVLLLDYPQVAAACLLMMRSIEPKRPAMAIMEDLDSLLEKHGENEYLSLLDGEAQIDSIVFLATTNYPERLDKRFVDRPSRFDTIRYVGMPCAEARRAYLKAKEPKLTEDELDLWVRRSDGFSIAHLKELIIAVKCFGQDLENVVDRLEAMQDRKISSDGFPGRNVVGFGKSK
jgi:hypothetical protein